MKETRHKLSFTMAIVFMALFLPSCGFLGIHTKVHNPKKPGKAVKFSKETVLLGELNAFRNCFDVHYYDLSLTVDPNEKQLKGRVHVFANALTDFDTLQLDLDQTFAIEKLIDLETGNSLTYRREERAIYIYHPQRKQAAFSLSIHYMGNPIKAKKPPWKGGFVWKKNKGKPWIGVACESEGASIWWPCKDHTSDEPDSMRLHYTVPKDLTAVGNGQLEGKVEEGGKTTFNWFISYPINVYNVTLYVGDFVELKDEFTGVENKTLTISHYVLPENYEKAKVHFQQLHPMLRSFEKLFGPYPWYRDGFKFVESPYAGMEHQTAIAYGSGYKNRLSGHTDYIILHETAHEWWGNSISASDLKDVWLQEGFATYAEALYLEDAYNMRLAEGHLSLYKLFIKNKYPVVGVSGRRDFHFRRSSDVYVKGAWILHTLRKQMENDTLFFEILRSFYLNYQYQTVTSQDFINWVNQKTQQDYSWFFKQYLYKNEAPALEFATKTNDVLYYRWSNTDTDFTQLKIELLYNGKTVEITPTTAVQSIQLGEAGQPASPINIKLDRLFAHKRNNRLKLPR